MLQICMMEDECETLPVSTLGKMMVSTMISIWNAISSAREHHSLVVGRVEILRRVRQGQSSLELLRISVGTYLGILCTMMGSVEHFTV